MAVAWGYGCMVVVCLDYILIVHNAWILLRMCERTSMGFYTV